MYVCVCMDFLCIFSVCLSVCVCAVYMFLCVWVCACVCYCVSTRLVTDSCCNCHTVLCRWVNSECVWNSLTRPIKWFKWWSSVLGLCLCWAVSPIPFVVAPVGGAASGIWADSHAHTATLSIPNLSTLKAHEPPLPCPTTINQIPECQPCHVVPWLTRPPGSEKHVLLLVFAAIW